MMRLKILFIAFISSAFTANAQEILSPEQASAITLENNYGILIAKNNIQVATNNTDKKANGYLSNEYIYNLIRYIYTK